MIVNVDQSQSVWVMCRVKCFRQFFVQCRSLNMRMTDLCLAEHGNQLNSCIRAMLILPLVSC